MAFDPEKLPVWLRRTPEQQAKDDAYQEQLKQAMGPGVRPNATERHLMHAQAIRISAEAQLTHLYSQPDASLERVEHAKAQMAEALALQGHFTEAADLHPSPERKAQYAAIAEAVDRDDNAPACQCPAMSYLEENQQRQVMISPLVIRKMVFSHKHKKLMPLVECLGCGDLNVRPAPLFLAERQRRINEAHQRAQSERGRRRGT